MLSGKAQKKLRKPKPVKPAVVQPIEGDIKEVAKETAEEKKPVRRTRQAE